jgi:hypothetical protein
MEAIQSPLLLDWFQWQVSDDLILLRLGRNSKHSSQICLTKSDGLEAALCSSCCRILPWHQYHAEYWLQITGWRRRTDQNSRDWPERTVTSQFSSVSNLDKTTPMRRLKVHTSLDLITILLDVILFGRPFFLCLDGNSSGGTMDSSGGSLNL